MSFKNTLFYLSVLFILSGCDAMFGMDVTQNITGNYYLTAPDAEEQLSLTYRDTSESIGYSGIIEQTVFAVGFNKDYIIAKQHPNNIRNTTNYYILSIKHMYNWRTNEELTGPLSKEQFEQKKKELNLEKLNFTIVYKDLE